MTNKYPGVAADAAVQIAEEAFRAGYEAGIYDAAFSAPDWYSAWSEFEPSEDCKDLLS
jgi:hypothetical protein